MVLYEKDIQGFPRGHIMYVLTAPKVADTLFVAETYFWTGSFASFHHVDNAQHPTAWLKHTVYKLFFVSLVS